MNVYIRLKTVTSDVVRELALCHCMSTVCVLTDYIEQSATSSDKPKRFPPLF